MSFNSHQWYLKGLREVEAANTIITNGALDFPDKATLAGKLIGVSESNISYFAIVGNNTEAFINVNYGISVYGLNLNGGTATRYLDLGGKCIYIGSSNYTGVSFDINWEELYFPEAVLINNLPGNWSFGFGTKLRILYAPKLLDFGPNSVNDAVFRGQLANLLIVYVDPSLATKNAGSPDGDLVHLQNLGATIRYVSNFTKPKSITNLSIGTIYAQAMRLDFNEPTGSTNDIEFYHCYANGEYKNTIYGSGGFITGLKPDTLYKIEVKPIDIYYNISQSNELYETTNAIIPIPGLVSYYKLDYTRREVLDSYGANNGRSFGVTKEIAGKIGSGFSYDGVDDYVDLSALNSSFNGVDFSIGCWFKTTQTTTYRLLQNRGGGSLGAKRGWQISCFAGSHWGNTAIDDGEGNGFVFDNVSYLENDNKWHLIILTWNSSLGRGRLYIDGTLKQEKSNALMALKNLNSEAVLAGKSSSNDQYFLGSMDEIPFAEKEWNSAEVSEIFNNGNGITL